MARALVVLAFAILLVPGALAAVPNQHHLSIVPGGLAVTFANVGGERNLDARVEYGATDALGKVAEARFEASLPPGIAVYSAVLTDLEPGKTFRYRAVLNKQAGPVFEARAPPAAGEPLRFVAFADHGHEHATSRETVAAALAADPDLVLVAGDISYADGRSIGWETWFGMVEPLAASRPLMPAAGNHEREDVPIPTAYDSRSYDQFKGRFVLPGDEFHFGFGAGNVHFVVVNSEDACATSRATVHTPYIQPGECKDAAGNQTLMARLDALLSSPEAKAARWLVVMFHRPVYTWGAYEGNPIIEAHWRPLFERHGVDLVLTGHDHIYARTHALKDGKPVSAGPEVYAEGEGPVYVVTGGGGNKKYDLRPPPYPEWLAVANSTFHVTHVRADAKRLAVEAHEVPTGALVDRFVIGEPFDPPIGDPPTRATPGPAPVLLAAAAALLALAARRKA
ncbi:MAG TPA: metallophosphoesterase [Candidatus Thermoplasmatota archaeon]|nr:metallophosphoesterase [Candidatus Thermoplasmatota archaeon]